MPPSKMRLIPRLSAAELKAERDKEPAMWYCLRAINHGQVKYAGGRRVLMRKVSGNINKNQRKEVN